MTKPRYISDRNMLKLADRLKSSGVIKFRQQFLDVIGMTKQNFRRVGLGEQSFNPDQIRRACEEYGEDANIMIGVKKRRK